MRTPLMIACLKQKTEFATKLVKKKADILAMDGVSIHDSLYCEPLFDYIAYMYIHQACKQVHTVRASSFAGRTMCSTYVNIKP